MKIHSFVRFIGQGEGLDGRTLLALEAAAIVHDVGIKAANEKYGYCNGKLQEQEDPETVQNVLKQVLRTKIGIWLCKTMFGVEC